ncbi:MAG: coenzyme F420-0:L-glutamate ligase [Ornithinibacter sp.]
MTVLPVSGVSEVVAGDDLAQVLLAALAAGGADVRPGDCLVVSSKVVSKALGLTWEGSRESAVAAHTVRVVAERGTAAGDRAGDGGGDGGGAGAGAGARVAVTRVVESLAGPVMAAAGVDASNTGPTGMPLLLPTDPDGEARDLRTALLQHLGLPAGTALAVVLSDTAGRPWRVGLTDFALGSAGLRPVEDLRGGTDHDGRALSVTERALADEVAAAADLVKGKVDGIPAAVLRGLPAEWFDADAPGARALVRTDAADWFALGHVEAVRAALGVAPGSALSQQVGVRSVREEPFADRVARVVALALHDVEDGSADVWVRPRDDFAHGTTPSPASGTAPSPASVTAPSPASVTAPAPASGTAPAPASGVTSDSAEVTLGAPEDYDLGRLVARLEVAAHSEDLRATPTGRAPGSVTVSLHPTP